MIRTAVIGVGSMGRNHARVYQDLTNSNLVAIVDADYQLAESISRLYGGKAYTDVDEMVSKEHPEAVSVAVPTKDHFSVVSKMINYGCHVLVEKPICATIDEAERLVQLSEQSGKILMVGHIERFNPAILELKKRLENNELGRIFHLHASRLGPFPARIRDVGVILDLATHDLDIMLFLTGSEATHLFAETKQVVHETNEDLVNGLVHFSNGAIGLIDINWLTPTKIRELTVTGEKGMFRVNYITQDLSFYENAAINEDSTWSTISLLRGVSEGSIIQYSINKKEPLKAELETFIRSVENSEISHGGNGKAALSLALALLQSAEEGRVVNLITDL